MPGRRWLPSVVALVSPAIVWRLLVNDRLRKPPGTSVSRSIGRGMGRDGVTASGIPGRRLALDGAIISVHCATVGLGRIGRVRISVRRWRSTGAIAYWWTFAFQVSGMATRPHGRRRDGGHGVLLNGNCCNCFWSIHNGHCLDYKKPKKKKKRYVSGMTDTEVDNSANIVQSTATLCFLSESKLWFCLVYTGNSFFRKQSSQKHII